MFGLVSAYFYCHLHMITC